MSKRIVILCAVCVWALAGCDSTDDQTADAAAKAEPAAVAEAARNLPPGVDDEDIVWADEAFLSAAGVKEGKDVMYMPTPPMVVDKMIELAAVQADDLVYDLGTGDGRIAIAAAKQTGCQVIGYEIDPDLVKQARENVRKSGVEDLVTIEEQDILELDFSPADVVLMYLTAELNVALIPQFEKLKPGARIVSHDWGMKGKVEADQVIENFRSKEPDFVNIHTIYLWKTPLRMTQ